MCREQSRVIWPASAAREANWPKLGTQQPWGKILLLHERSLHVGVCILAEIRAHTSCHLTI